MRLSSLFFVVVDRVPKIGGRELAELSAETGRISQTQAMRSSAVGSSLVASSTWPSLMSMIGPTKRVHDTKPLVEALELRNLGPGDSSRNETLRLEGDQGNTSRRFELSFCKQSA